MKKYDGVVHRKVKFRIWLSITYSCTWSQVWLKIKWFEPITCFFNLFSLWWVPVKQLLSLSWCLLPIPDLICFNYVPLYKAPCFKYEATSFKCDKTVLVPLKFWTFLGGRTKNFLHFCPWKFFEKCNDKL